MKTLAAWALVAAAFLGGLAHGGDGENGDRGRHLSPEALERFKQVRREVKHIEFETALTRMPGILEREKGYLDLLARMQDAAARGGAEFEAIVNQGRELKLQALAEYNEILKLHRGKYVSLPEKEVWKRLKDARFADVQYRDEWLVNILDQLEESVRVNIEIDARVYKYDTVSFDFEKTSARAMLQMMGDVLLFDWVIRGDTLYVFKERHEVLFGGEWIQQKRAAWRARKKAIEEAAKEAQRRALEEGQ